MIKFLSELRRRNLLLYIAGWGALLGALLCIVLSQTDATKIMGINAWIKPMKFFLSTTAFVWTMGWYMFYLNKKTAVAVYSWMVVLVLAFELVIIVWQASNGRLSHFNISTKFYPSLFNAMGIAIVTLVLWTIYITVLFFTRKNLNLPAAYLWGIRIGLICFIVFSFEGGMMAARLSHTVGSADGGDGLPLLNWSKGYGDLRVAHFFGMHALQILPLVGYYLLTKNWQLIIFSLLYISFVVILIFQALNKIPFLS